MDIPWLCGVCHMENMVDLDHLLERTVDKLITAEGFVCESCGMWEAISYRTLSLQEMERKLSRYRPEQQQFQFLFAKLVRKQIGLNERGENNGALQHPHMAGIGPVG